MGRPILAAAHFALGAACQDAGGPSPEPVFLRLSGVGDEPSDDPQKFLDRIEIRQRFHDPIHIESDVLVDEHVTKARKALELPDQIGCETGILRQVAHRGCTSSADRVELEPTGPAEERLQIGCPELRVAHEVAVGLVCG